MKAKVKSKLNLCDRIALQEVIPLNTPFLIYLDPSSTCNFRCRFCPSGHHKLVKGAGYDRTIMGLDLFKKAIDDLLEFDDPLKVLRLNKIGEPLLNKHLAEMVAYAEESGRVFHVDLATNGSLFDEKNTSNLIDAGLDQLNISIEGVSSLQYKEICDVDIDFEALVEKIKWLYAHKKDCEVSIKIPGNYLNKEQEEDFYRIFGDCCDRIFVENLSPIWPGFDFQELAGVVPVEEGQYGGALKDREVCSYIFYSMAINADGTVSACCPDWGQKLIVGDLKTMSLKEIWTSDEFNLLRRLHLQGCRKENMICRDCGHIVYCQVDDIDAYREELLGKLKKDWGQL